MTVISGRLPQGPNLIIGPNATQREMFFYKDVTQCLGVSSSLILGRTLVLFVALVRQFPHYCVSIFRQLKQKHKGNWDVSNPGTRQFFFNEPARVKLCSGVKKHNTRVTTSSPRSPAPPIPPPPTPTTQTEQPSGLACMTTSQPISY